MLFFFGNYTHRQPKNKRVKIFLIFPLNLYYHTVIVESSGIVLCGTPLKYT